MYRGRWMEPCAHWRKSHDLESTCYIYIVEWETVYNHHSSSSLNPFCTSLKSENHWYLEKELKVDINAAFKPQLEMVNKQVNLKGLHFYSREQYWREGFFSFNLNLSVNNIVLITVETLYKAWSTSHCVKPQAAVIGIINS